MWRFTLKQLLVAICFIAVLGSVSSHLMRIRLDRRRQHTLGYFHHLGTSLHCFIDTHGGLPDPVVRSSSGTPLLSWRYLLMAYDGSPGTLTPYRLSELHYEYAWSHPVNKTFQNWAGYSYVRENRKTPRTRTDHHTNIFAITGPGTAFGGAEINWNDPPPAILAVEVLNSGTHWTEPGDFDIRTMPKTINSGSGRDISSRYPGVHVLFATGEVWFISDRVPFDSLSKFFVADDAAIHNREELLGQYRIR